jgi:SpoIVB peptidase S55
MTSRHLAAALALAGLCWVSTPASTPIMPLSEVKPGMVGTGRTVFEGTELRDFKVTIVGVLKNVQGPRRDLIIARLEGGPLAETGVAAGMSGSPVYIDGRLIGAVGYSVGAFPKEAIAGRAVRSRHVSNSPSRTKPSPRRSALRISGSRRRCRAVRSRGSDCRRRRRRIWPPASARLRLRSS